MIYYAHIVRYTKTDPDSPGNLKVMDLIEALSDSTIIPEKFNVDVNFLVDYIGQLSALETFTKDFSGILAIKINKDITVFLFDSLESLQSYVTSRTLIPTWDSYTAHRDQFLEKIGLTFSVESPKEITADDSELPIQIVQNIV